MKTKVEIEGYEIEIEFINGVISVKAEKDDEVVEEFSIEVEEGENQEEVQDFREFGQDEEEDFEGEEDESGEDLEDELEGEDDKDDEDEVREPAALESFQSFINKNKK